MKYNITIIKIETNEERIIQLELNLDTDWLEYNFLEGNLSCDCNRRALFEQHYVEDSPCGKGAFIIRQITNDKGEVVYSEPTSDLSVPPSSP